MKSWKIFGALAAVALTSTSAMAAAGDGKISFGPQGGIVFSNFNTNGNAPFGNDFDKNTGYMAGAFLEFGIWSVTLRPEANYVQTGYNVLGADVKNNYLEIPLLLKINPFADSVVSPFIVLGPSWSKHLSSSATAFGQTGTVDFEGRDEIEEPYPAPSASPSTCTTPST
ncbi:MAG: PorT family protein [Proteobacteria bacterium]|nr:MAG: PorT family protein [Pseudomonadota bacterium]